MTPNDVAGLVGAAFAGAAGTGAVFVKFALPWFKQRDHDVAQIKTEVGVGTMGPSIVELVGSTATAVQRLENSSQRNGEGITRVIDTLHTHGVRLEALETRHELLSSTVGRFRDAFAAHDALEEERARKLETAAKGRRRT